MLQDYLAVFTCRFSHTFATNRGYTTFQLLRKRALSNYGSRCPLSPLRPPLAALSLFFSTCLVVVAPAAQEKKPAVAGTQDAKSEAARQAADELRIVAEEWRRAESAFYEVYGQRKATEQDKHKAKAVYDGVANALAERCLTLATKDPISPTDLTALFWAAGHAPASEPGKKALTILAGGRMARASLDEIDKAIAAGWESTGRRESEFAPIILERVKKSLDHSRAAKLLDVVCRVSVWDTGDTPPAFAEAADLIVKHFPSSPDISSFCSRFGALGGDPPPWAQRYEPHLRSILNANQHRQVRQVAQLGLALIASNAGESRQNEAQKLLQDFIRDFAESPKEARTRDWFDQNCLRIANLELDEIRTRGVGKPAPALEGEDLDGKVIRLSDFKGKVVLLDFWAFT